MEEEHKHNHVKEEVKEKEIVETPTEVEKKEERAEEKVEAKEENTGIKKISVPETSEEKQKVSGKKKQVIIKKDKVIMRGMDLHISTKHSMAICKFIKGKSIQVAIKDLEQVAKLKKVVPMKGEIPHKHGKGIMSGRYPVNASLVFIKLLKTLEGNARAAGIENAKITLASPSIASRPYGRFGAHRKKRTNVILEARIK